jgi:C-terminal processing protease CtpA/Prc
VTFVLKDGPAEASGLQPGDVLTALDEKAIEGMSPQDVSDLIRGPSESTLKLKVVRAKDNSAESETKTETLELAATRRAVVFKKVSG